MLVMMKLVIMQRITHLCSTVQVIFVSVLHFSLWNFILSLVTEELESSPLRGYLPKLIKRSASIDTSPSVPQDSSPPSDPWRFFTDIKGKITKSVEDKLTEIKSRNTEDESPRKSNPVKDSKESSSVSDSEELSESSISKTCGVISTTEGESLR